LWDAADRGAMAGIPNVSLSLTNRPENVLLVRQALSGLAETIGLDALELNDISTAVSEACNNVVMHAYAGGQGALEVEVYASAGGIEVVVRDHGDGIRLEAEAAEETDVEKQAAAGIGLPVIHALARRLELTEPPHGGTEVRMEFATPKASTLIPPDPPEGFELPRFANPDGADAIGMAIAPSTLARAVVPRVLSAVAARARFSTDRISDTHLLADALIAETRSSIDGTHLGVGISIAPRDLQLRIGPLRTGRASALLHTAALDGPAPVIERLTDDRRVTASGSSEMLALRLLDRSDGRPPADAAR
jgi:serine/threonine-protein kinase RsbW